jgi:peroxiredoxin
MNGIRKALWVVPWLLLILAAPGWSVEVGDHMPDFSIQTFDGRNLTRATLDGKPVLLVFWNTWCPNCLRELPKINRLAEKFDPQRLTVIAINTAFNDTEKKARAYWHKSEYVFPCGFDHTFEMGQAFAVRGVPTLFLVDDRGIIRFKQVVLPEDVETRIEQLSRE